MSAPSKPVLVLALVLAHLVASCNRGAPADCVPSAPFIESLERTVDGPERLVALARDIAQPTALRVQAALALLSMDRVDVDGAKLFVDAAHDADAETTVALTDAFVLYAERTLAGAAPPETATAPDVQRRQARVKDCATDLANVGSDEVRARLEAAVMRWYATSLAERMFQGDRSIENVMETFGPSSVAKLLPVLDPRVPNFETAARIIAEHADAETRVDAAVRVVAIGATLESDDFAVWLTDAIRAGLATTGRAADLDDDRIAAVALLNRGLMRGQWMTAMGRFANERVVSERLDAIAADVSLAPDVRVDALRALEGHGAAHVDTMLAILAARESTDELRDFAADRLLESSDLRVIDPLRRFARSQPPNRAARIAAGIAALRQRAPTF